MKRTKWPVVSLGTIAEFRNGLNYNKGNFGVGLKVINVKDFQDRLIADFTGLDEINPDGLVRDECFIRDGDILFVRSNGNRELIGRSMLVTGVRERISHSAFSIKTRFTTPDALPRFYAYLFRTSLIRSELSNRGGGTNISNLNQDILSNLAVPKPPLPTQRKIAGVLSAYDDLIANNTRRIAILEEMAQAIYREWFVNFRFPGHEKVKFVSSTLGKIPEGWAATVSDFGEVITGRTPTKSKPESFGGGIAFIKTPDIHGNLFCISTSETLSEAGFASQPSQTVPPNSVCISCIGTVGAISITTVTCQTNQQINTVIPRSSYWREFIVLCLRNSVARLKQIGAAGATMDNISKGKLMAFDVLLPPSDILTAFSSVTSDLFDRIRLLQKQIKILRITRDLLLPKLISGQLDVEELDIDIGESLAEAEK